MINIHLSDIPNEVLFDHLLPFIPQHHLIALKSTNHNFNKLIWNYWITHKTSYILPYRVKAGQLENINKYYLSKLVNLQEINSRESIDNDEIQAREEIDDLSFFKILRSLNCKIRKLDLLACDAFSGFFLQDAIDEKLQMVNSLEELLMCGFDFHIENLSLSSFSNLKQLTLIGNGISVDIKVTFPSKLEKLVVDYILPTAVLKNIPNQCPNLMELRLRGVSEKNAQFLMKNLPKLSSFHFMYPEIPDVQLTNSIFTTFKEPLKLKSLSLFVRADITVPNNAFGKIVEHLTDLSLFIVGIESTKNNNSLLEAICSLPNLNKLKLLFMTRVSFSKDLIKKLSDTSSFNRLESVSCDLVEGAGILLPVLVGRSLKELSVTGFENQMNFEFLSKCQNVKSLHLDASIENHNLEKVIVPLPHLESITGNLITSEIVKKLTNKKKLRNLSMVYDHAISLLEFTTLETLNILDMSVPFPNHLILPLRIYTLSISSFENPSGSEMGFVKNIQSLTQLRVLKLKQSSIQDEIVNELCTNDSPIESIYFNGCSQLTNQLLSTFKSMKQLTLLLLVDCPQFRDINEISLLEHERDFHFFCTKIKERKFNMERALKTITENLQSIKVESANHLFEELNATLIPNLLKERKLVELNLYMSRLLDLPIKDEYRFTILCYTLQSVFSFDYMNGSSFTKLLKYFANKIENGNFAFDREALIYSLSKALPVFIALNSTVDTFLALSILLDFNVPHIIAKHFARIAEDLLDLSGVKKYVDKFMKKCLENKINLHQSFSHDSISQFTSNTRFSTLSRPFGLMVAKAYNNNFLYTGEGGTGINNVIPQYTPIPDCWKGENTFTTCIEISKPIKWEMYKKVHSETFKAFGFNWFMTIHSGEDNTLATCSLYLQSTQHEDDSSSVLEYLRVDVAFFPYYYSNHYSVHSHKFQHALDNISQNHFSILSTEFKNDAYDYKIVVCMKLLEKSPSLNNTLSMSSASPLYGVHPWIDRQLSKNIPMSHHNISILTPLEVLEDYNFSSNLFNVFGNNINIYLTPISRKSGLFSIDLLEVFKSTDIFKIKYLIANESFDRESIQIRKYNRIELKNYQERKSGTSLYFDSEEFCDLLNPSFYKPTIIEQSGKYFNKYAFQIVFFLGNTTSGLEIADEFEDDEIMGEWEDV
ncbi:predicted protein [Naegleria gruberi]|uniref:Predicted protein n=1 Tax=Naegleria gruberi TaxID=5762 RepID=D2UX15_NAEGR|nr:uncharacterized protein NAEGRDRAFT_45265 [Naegleria gruberi]EFC50855.1 predicted protein [Naegleria gruberi]|eukprot:XP_002683599.1 predicted protein [Naegleria gruberi strain NEG-M]